MINELKSLKEYLLSNSSETTKRPLVYPYFKKLFGNWEYGIQVLKPGSYYPIIKYTLTPKPDTTNNFDVSF